MPRSDTPTCNSGDTPSKRQREILPFAERTILLRSEAILLFLLSVAVMTFYGDDVYQHYGVVDSVYYPIFFVNH